MAKLKEQLLAVAKEYARQFGEIIGMDAEHCVGEEPAGMWCFGDCYFFSLEEMKDVVDHIDKYVTRYGSKEAVGDEIRDWVDWWLDDCGDIDCRELVGARVTSQLRVNINLKSWLEGCPREDMKPWSGPDAKYMELKHDHETLTRLVGEYRENRTLGNVLQTIEKMLDKETEAKAKRDFEEWQRFVKKNDERFFV